MAAVMIGVDPHKASLIKTQRPKGIPHAAKTTDETP
jgi:hypothetical protein